MLAVFTFGIGFLVGFVAYSWVTKQDCKHEWGRWQEYAIIMQKRRCVRCGMDQKRE